MRMLPMRAEKVRPKTYPWLRAAVADVLVEYVWPKDCLELKR